MKRFAALAIALTCACTVAVAADGGAMAATSPIVSRPVTASPETTTTTTPAPAEAPTDEGSGETAAPAAEVAAEESTPAFSTSAPSPAPPTPAKAKRSAPRRPVVGAEIVVPPAPPQNRRRQAGAGNGAQAGQRTGAGQSHGLSPETGAVPTPGSAPAAFASLEPSLTLPLAQADPLVDFFIGTYRTPPFLLPIYLAAAERYDVPWQALAAINEVESDYGSDVNVSSAGAAGWMQFMPAEWAAYGVDASGAGVRDPYSPADAIFAAARYLAAADASTDLRGAIFAYNHSSSYVEAVMLRAQLLQEAPESLIGGLTAIVDGRSPVPSGGELAQTPVWSTPAASPATASRHVARTLSAPTGVPAPAPQVAAASGTGSTERAIVGARITTAPGAPVLAVQRAEIVGVGHSAKLGRFIELRDPYGDTYTYAQLGHVLAQSALASPDATAPGSAGAQPATMRAGQLQHLRRGAWVTPGTVLGNVASAASGAHAGFLLAIAPTGAGPIDPRPILAAWRALGATQGQPLPDTEPLFGPTAADAVISEIMLMSEPQLQAHLLSDPDLALSACSRHAIATGDVDRRVLAALEFLIASGLDPTVSTLACHGGGGALSASANRGVDAVTLSAFNGVAILGHHGSGSVAAQAVRRLLTLPDAMRPDRIVAPGPVAASMGNPVAQGQPAAIEIDFGSERPTRVARGALLGHPTTDVAGRTGTSASPAAHPATKGARSAPALNTAQWRKLIARVLRLPQPHVPGKPTGAAVPDTQASPLPTAETESPLTVPAIVPATPVAPGPTELAASTTEAPPATDAAPTTEAPPATNAAPATEAPPAREAETVQLGSPLADSVVPLTANPQFTLEAPSASNGVLVEEEQLKVTSKPTTAIQSAEFQIKPAESSTWTTIERTTRNETFFETHTLGTPDGLYDLRVLVTAVGGGQYVAELPDRLIDNHESPVFDVAAKPSSNLRGTVELTARRDATVPILFGERVIAVNFEYAPSQPGASRHWNLIERVAASPTSQEAFTASFETNTPSTPDGRYDLRLVPEVEVNRQTEQLAAIPLRELLLDNTAPNVSLSNPGSSLSGVVALSATAQDPEPASGVASVIFERARAGSNAWQATGTATVASPAGSDTYTQRLHTETLPNGSYEFRATAVDAAGNRATSGPIAEVEVQNPVLPPAVSASAASVVAPAEDVTILGTVGADSGGEHEAETWAYGITKAPPAEVGGSPLPYTAQGYQLVLLRYTERNRWQIVEVLRDPGGAAPYELVAADKLDVNASGGVYVSGSVTPSGEAWLWVDQTQFQGAGLAHKTAMFHRLPGGRFEYDPAATTTLAPLPTESHGDLRLQQDSEGRVFGLLTADSQVYGYLKEGTWSLQATPTPPAGVPGGGPMELRVGDLQGAGELWGAFTVANRSGVGLILGHFYSGTWHFQPHGVGLDALDLTGTLAQQPGAYVEPEALRAEPEGTGVWVEASVVLPGHEAGRVVAQYEEAHEGRPGSVTSWCSLPVANSCEQPLGLAKVPDAFFNTGSGQVALALYEGAVHVYSHGVWTQVITPGYTQDRGESFTEPNSGWLGGTKAVGRWSTGETNSLTPWPLPDRWPLTSIALPPSSQGLAAESGALAVGLNGASLHYESGVGWLVAPTPPRARHINLLGVAFAGPSSAFAVGQFGVILRWNGASWSEDPQSVSVTQSQLNAVAFAPSGEGWAVGAQGTILHYNGERWAAEQPPHGESGADITSVAVAGSEVFAVADGTLITRGPGSTWEAVNESLLPSTPTLTPGHLRLVAGLPDGGVVVAGNAVMLVREASGQSFQYASQPLSGVAVALAPFRESNGDLRAYVSIAPPVSINGALSGFPPGDGDLLRQTEDGWQDVSGAQYAGTGTSGDGEVKSDPVLAVATGPSGEHAWAVGGYAGSEDAAEQGVEEVLSARSTGWDTASIWRFDSSETVTPPALAPTTPSLPAKTGTVSFAFFSGAMCRVQCSAVNDAQPSVNLKAAAEQISAYSQQPGGPAFAVLGGNARGPLEGVGQAADEAQQADFAQLPELLAPLGALPTFAALGRYDHVPGQQGETPWAEAFAGAPQPFGSGGDPAGIAADSSGAPTLGGDVNRYYSFTAEQNGGLLRVIVLDNSEGSLEASAATSGQRGWLEEQLRAAEGEEEPVVVFASEPLHEPAPLGRGASDGESVATLLANSGVLAVFTTNPAQLDRQYLIPENPGEGPQIPEYEGASLGYQQPSNDGVMWYDVSVNTTKQTLKVSAVPVINSLALKPVSGLTVPRSSTLQFEAVGRRPAGTLATRVGESPLFPGYGNYVEIPASKCSGCVLPSYTFTSSEPTIGTFVEPIAAGSPLPKLEEKGHPIPSASSGLFCAYNAGTTTVSVTAGLYSYSLPVTVSPGGVGAPCGTVTRANNDLVHVQTKSSTARNEGANVGKLKTPLSNPLPAALLAIPPLPTPAPHAAAHAPAPVPPAPAPSLPQAEPFAATPPILSAAAPPVEPIPPGAGGFAQSPATAKRKEEVHKHASQSAFTLQPVAARESEGGGEWFYWTVGGAAILAMLLIARGLPAGPGARPALLLLDRRDAPRQPRSGPSHRPRGRRRPF